MSKHFQNFFDNTTKALNELQHGNVWGVVYIPSNFSQSFQERIEDSFNLPKDIVNSSQIIAWVDISSKNKKNADSPNNFNFPLSN